MLRRSRYVGLGRCRKDVCFGFDSVHGAALACHNVKYINLQQVPAGYCI